MQGDILVGYVLWFNPETNFGVVQTDAGTTFGFSKNAACPLETDEDEPRFDPLTITSVEDPEKGQRLKFEDGGLGRRSGKPMIRRWCFESTWSNAVRRIVERKQKESAERIRLEQERLRCNPNFRCVEQEHRFGKPTGKPATVIFTGTKQGFIDRSSPRFYSPPMVFENGPDVGGYMLVRTFQRETANGWEPCGDPRKLKLPLSFGAVKKMLSQCNFDCLRDRAFGDEEFGWSKDDKRIADGYCAHGEYSLSIRETEQFAETSFDSKDAEELYESGGVTRSVDFNDAGDPREW